MAIDMMAIDIRGAVLQARPVTHAELDVVLEVYRNSEDFLALGPVATASMPTLLADI